MRHPSIAQRARTALVVVDMQERLFPLIEGKEEVLRNALRLVDLCRRLEMPLILTEQYPKGLGPTIDPLRTALAGEPLIEKTTFSCLGEPAFVARIAGLGVDTLALCGIEAHICVAQTALDALAHGLAVHLVADATGSRHADDRELALGRLRQAGVIVTGFEMLAYELLERAATPLFRAALPLFK